MNTVVYYPYINPCPEWLRVAALCWDKVFVLGARDLPDEPEIAKLDAALGGVIDRRFYVSDIADDAVVGQFQAWVQAHEPELKAHTFESQTDATMFALHAGKFASGPGKEAFLFLMNRGLAEIGSVDSRGAFTPVRMEVEVSESIFMPANIALHYLSLCASKAAATANSDLVADGETYMETVMYDYRALRGDVSTTVLHAHLPERFESLDPHQIADFRQEFSAQRLKFSREIQAVCREFGEVASEGQLQSFKNRIVEIANERIEEVRGAYRRGRLETITKMLGISVAPPAIVASLGSVLGIGIFAPAAIVAGLSLAAAAAASTAEKTTTDRSKSPWSYALDSSVLGGRTPLADVARDRIVTRARDAIAAPTALDREKILEERRARKELRQARKRYGREK